MPPRRSSAIRLALISGPDPGHAFPCIAAAVALHARGHDVAVGTGPDWRDAIERAGPNWFELPALRPTARDVDFGYRVWGRAAEMAPPLADLLEGDRTEAVVTDTLTAAGGFAADLLGLPWVELSPQFLYDPSPAVPPVGLGARPPRTALGRWGQERTRERQRRSIAEGDRLRARMRDHIGLGDASGRVGRLVATLPGLEYPRPGWPPTTYVVGSLGWEPRWPALAPPPGDEPLVVVTDSTASSIDRSLAATAVPALGRLGVRLAVTTGRALDAAGSSGVTVGRGSHGDLFAQADLVVCPGGHGTVAKALTAGVPVITVPLQGDQRETARRVAVAGAGVTVPWGPLLPTRLAVAVRYVLARPRFRRAARALAAGAAGLGPGYAARVIERLVVTDAPAGRR